MASEFMFNKEHNNLFNSACLKASQDDRVQLSDPITELEDIQKLKDYFLNSGRRFNAIRNYTIFCFGISTGLTCIDVLHLKVGDVMNSDGTIKDEITIKNYISTEESTVLIDAELQKVISDYITERNTTPSHKVTGNWNFLFTSNKTGCSIDTQSWSGIMSDAGEILNLPYHLGSNSMRKTYLYWQMANYFKEKFQTEQDKKIDKILAAINNGATIVSKEELIELLNE